MNNLSTSRLLAYAGIVCLVSCGFLACFNAGAGIGEAIAGAVLLLAAAVAGEK